MPDAERKEGRRKARDFEGREYEADAAVDSLEGGPGPASFGQPVAYDPPARTHVDLEQAQREAEREAKQARDERARRLREGQGER